MPHYKFAKQVLTIICGDCAHIWISKSPCPTKLTCPKCKKEDVLQAKL